MIKFEKLRRLTALIMTVFMLWSSIMFNCCTAFADAGLIIPTAALTETPDSAKGSSPDEATPDHTDETDETDSESSDTDKPDTDTDIAAHDPSGHKETEDEPVETETEPYLDPPDLRVVTPPNNTKTWVKDFSSWKVEAEPIENETITILYKTHPYTEGGANNIDWGDISGAKEWNNDDLPIGKNYIRFWAVSSNKSRKIYDSGVVYTYMLDNVAPENPSFSSDYRSEWLLFWNVRVLYLTVENILDKHSGVGRVYFTRTEKNIDGLTEKDIISDGDFKEADLTYTEEHTLCFEIPFDCDLKDSSATVVVFDNAGNMTAVRSNALSNLVLPEETEYCLVRTEDDSGVKKVVEKDTHIVHSSDTDIMTEYYYVNDSDLLIVRAIDDNPNELNLTVRCGKNKIKDLNINTKEIDHEIVNATDTDVAYYESYEKLIEEFHKDDPVSDTDTSSDSDTALVTDIDKSSDSDNSSHSDENSEPISRGTAYFVISINYLMSQLKLSQSTADNVYSFDLMVSDQNGHSNKATEKIFYDPNVAAVDSVINVKYPDTDVMDGCEIIKEIDGKQIDEYFFSVTPQDNKVEFTFNDDVGLRNYVIDLIGPEGREPSCSGIISKRNELPVTELPDIPVVLSKNGYYFVSVTVYDLAGNKNTRQLRFFVDNTPPTIKRMSYETSKSLISYLTLGLYGKESVTISIDVTDDRDSVEGIGLDEKDVVLEWDGALYTSKYKDGKYVFQNLDPKTVSKETKAYSKPSITVTDRLGNTNKYYLQIDGSAVYGSELDSDGLIAVTDEASGVTLILESDAPKFTVNIADDSNYILSPDYKGGYSLIVGSPNEEPNTLLFSFSDNTGLRSYDIVVKSADDGSVIANTEWKSTADTPPVKDAICELELKDAATGRYVIETTVTDLAGNQSTEPVKPLFSYPDLYIDKAAPEVVDTEYEVSYSLLHYLTFGIFGNSKIKLSLKVADGENGSGSSSAKLYWDGQLEGDKTGDTSDGSSCDIYIFKNLTPNRSGRPYIEITDRLGNVSIYYFTTNEKESKNEGIQIGELILKNAASPSVKLMLETIPPEVEITVDKSHKVYNIDGKDWYGDDITYNVTARESIDVPDKQTYSGLNHVSVYENDTDTDKYHLTSCSDIDTDTEIVFSEKEYNKTAKYSFEISKEGSYNLYATAYDNAGNSSSDEISFSIDKTDPEIYKFVFGTENEDPPYIKRDTYGYFFQEETEVKLYVIDPSVSAGFDKVMLYLLSSQENENVTVKTVYADDFMIDANGVYALFTIPVGYKGQVGAEVIDRVERTSRVQNPDGSIIEDERIHNDTSSIEIKEDIQTKNTDANDIPLHNDRIPLTITVKDTFSGIETIEWSIENDIAQGVISVDKDGGITNNSELAVINDEKIDRDSNLVTGIELHITVTSNTNGNNVTVKMQDRSGNKSEAEKTYSIDTTAPSITADLSNTNAVNDRYYNTDQIVTITITERNFDADDVLVLVNGSAQSVSWSESGKTLGNDDTTHKGTFSINTDGEYQFSVSYTDLAGNSGDTFSQPMFIIDKIAPSIVNNFADFGKPDDKEIFMNAEQKDAAKAVITVKEVNFYDNDMRIEVFYKESGSPHSDGDWEKYPVSSDWKAKAKDEYELVIPFDFDGIYMVKMDPVDRAGNIGVFEKNEKTNSTYPKQTAIFETDYTKPILCERDGMFVKETDTSYCDYYDFERRSDPSPTVMFSDVNIRKISCDIVKYVPVYKNGRDLGVIKPDEEKMIISEYVSGSTDKMLFSLGGFDSDGVYSVKLIATDKAGNKSELTDNTYVRMVDPENKVLAYIENSNKETGEGWYSFENDNGPISKQPDSFSDLSIVVFSKKTETSHIYLTDKDTSVKTDTGITSDPDSVFDNSMYSIHGCRYILPGEYFSNNYSADADAHLFLQVENSRALRDIGEIYIDNTVPTCVLPDHFKNWGWISGSGDKTLLFKDVSEELDQTKTVAYIDGVETKLDSDSVFSYSEDANERTLSLTLSPGSHSVGLVMVDKAGNEGKVNEVSHLAIGNSRIWISVSSVLGTLLAAFIAMILTKHRNNSRIKK